MDKRSSIERSVWMLRIILGLLPLVWVSVSLGQTTSITSSGLNTQVSHGAGQPNYDITGGTRPDNGTNLFHSFGDFSVGTDQAARFLNDSGLATSNILSRVTGGHVSNIFGEINTTNFPGANLYLINPAGVLFGPTATLNVSGSVHVSTADYLRLADGLRFNAIPGPQDTLLSQAPVVAFGFLQAHPRPITVQGSQLSVAEGKGLSLVGGDVRITKGTLTAPGGQVNLVSLAGRGEARVSPEGITIAGWTSRGQIVIKGGTEPENVARLDTSGAAGGAIVLRGGKLSLVRAEFTTQAKVDNQTGGTIVVEATKSATFDTVGLRTGESNLDLSDPRASLNGGTVSLTAPTVRAANLTIDTSGNWDGLAGDVAINVQTLSASNLNLSNSGSHSSASANISIQASGPVTLRNSGIGSNEGFDSGGQNPGHITVRAATLMLERTRMSSFSVLDSGSDAGAGDIAIDVGRLTMLRSSIRTETVTLRFPTQAGNIGVSARDAILIDGSRIATFGNLGGSITLSTPHLTLNHLGSISTGSDGARAGDVSVNVRTLNMLNGGRITGDADAGNLTGNINIVASQSISIAGVGVDNLGNQLPSGISMFSGARAGSIHLVTPTMRLADGATVRVIGRPSDQAPSDIVLDVGRLDILRGARIENSSFGINGSVVINAAKSITLDHGTIKTVSDGNVPAGNVHLHAGKSILIRNGSLISADNTGPYIADMNNAGNIAIRAGKNVVIRDSTVSAKSQGGNGGTILVDAKYVALRNSQLTTSVSRGPDTVGGRIVVDAKHVTLRNSQLLSTATEGDGGTIHIRSRAFHKDATSVIDVSSESGTDGTVTIESRY
ncbi:MAG: filamentous hemagglutinin N-terminal domain-containing protein [Nitrospira sp.]|nr:MAG: filamentous hemagglutinin N-terminal domain-containing protein [Nitrospira sp.]